MIRDNIFKNIDSNTFDVIVIGGGATGLGCALDAVARGYKTLLVEAIDYSKATSSRSTKLLHGGVRYLAQGHISLVKSALTERYLILNNAPHLSKECLFIIPIYNILKIPYYLAGLKVYDLLAGSVNLTPSKRLSKNEVISNLPSINTTTLKGGIQYSDGVFDDSRMGVTLLRTFLSFGGVAANYLKVTNFIKENSKVIGVELLDKLNNHKLIAKSKCIINATGIFADQLRILDNNNTKKIIKWAQGIHLVLDRKCFAGNNALVLPKTSDGRVLFFVPWYNKVLCGTTDTLVNQSSYEPKALHSEIEFVLSTANKYLANSINYNSIDSVYAGIRPLVIDGHSKTSKIARNDKIIVSSSGLITVAGGKWTTYRKMAQDTIDYAIKHELLKASTSRTEKLHLYGYISREEALKVPEPFRVYGSDYKALSLLPSFSNNLSDKLTINEAQVEYAVNYEQAQTIEDVLSRRTRVLFLDAKESVNIAPKVAKIMARLLKKDLSWENSQLSDFKSLASNYIINNY